MVVVVVVVVVGLGALKSVLLGSGVEVRQSTGRVGRSQDRQDRRAPIIFFHNWLSICFMPLEMEMFIS